MTEKQQLKAQIIRLNKTIDPQTLFKAIEDIVQSHNISYGDAIIHYCSRTNFEIETIAEIIKKNPKMTAAIQNEYENLNMLPKTARLPV